MLGLVGFLNAMRLAARSLRRRPGFALGASLTLVLGLGATLVVLRLVDATLLRPLPGVVAPERIVAVRQPSVSYPSFVDFRDGAAATLELAGFQNRPLVVGLPAGSERVEGAVVSGGFFTVLGVRPAAGRLLGETDDAAGAAPVAVLGARFAERLGGVSAVGTTVRVNDVPFTVVGIAAPEFRGVQVGTAPQVWIPMHAWATARPSSFAARDLALRSWSWINLFGRLRPGVDPARAASALDALAARQEQEHPRETRTHFHLELVPALDAVLGGGGAAARGFGALLAGAALLVLLLACANVANLLLARGESRRRELATRAALGASRRQLGATVLAEALLLTLGAAAGGLVLVGAAARLATSLTLPGGVALGTFDLLPDARLALAALGLAGVAAALLGVLPARGAARSGLAAGMRGGAGPEPGRSRLAGALVAVQVALAVVLLAGAGLLGRALAHALALDTGLATGHVALATLDTGLARYDAPRAGATIERALESVAALPDVTHAAWTGTVPLTRDWDSESITVPGYAPAPDEQPEVEVQLVSRDYLATVGLPLVRGRGFAAEDRAGDVPGALANAAFVRRYLAGREPLGVEIGLVGRKVRLVGVVADARQHDLVSPAAPALLLPLEAALPAAAQQPLTLLVRTAAEPDALLPALARTLREAAPGAPVYGLGTFDDVYAALLAPQRFGAGLLGAFGLIGLVVAAVGVFSVVSYAASRRTREIGVRTALGATARDVLRLFVGESLRRVGLGVVAGLLLAAGLAQALRALLYGVSPLDPAAYAAAGTVLLAVAALAAFLPARRAAAADPIAALKDD